MNFNEAKKMRIAVNAAKARRKLLLEHAALLKKMVDDVAAGRVHYDELYRAIARMV